jgi:hypothetical protein
VRRLARHGKEPKDAQDEHQVQLLFLILTGAQ